MLIKKKSLPTGEIEDEPTISIPFWQENNCNTSTTLLDRILIVF